MLLDPQTWITLVTLSAIEIVLGIDNLVFISIAPFTTRNTPPRISTTSRTEMPCPKSSNRLCVRPASQASVSSSAMRVMQATAMPNLRAFSRCACGSLLTAIEMNTRLSMPSTISIELSVTSRIHTCGSVSISIQLMQRSSSCAPSSCVSRLRPAGHQNRGPTSRPHTSATLSIATNTAAEPMSFARPESAWNSGP